MIARQLQLILFLVVVASNSATSEEVSCFDEDGNPVDWYIAYKFPKLAKEPYPYKTGHAYAYITSESVKQVDPIADYSISEDADLESVVFLNRFKQLLTKYLGFLLPGQQQSSTKSKKAQAKESTQKNGDLYWTISAKLITDPKSVIMRTLSIAYDNSRSRRSTKKHSKSSLNSIFYNDQPPQNGDEEAMNSNSRAHAKGVVLIDDDSGYGVWLTHSTPHFPPHRGSELEFFENSVRNGQTFMCINFDTARSGAQIVNHLVNMFPVVYDSEVSDKLKKQIPALNSLALEGQRRRKKSVTKLAQVITTRQGQDLYLFSKSAQLGEDMYSAWIDKELGTSLYVETWRMGSGNPLDSFCPRHDFSVNNVQDLKVIDNKSQINWAYSNDHSKWAISDNIDPGVVCIADINRMQSQFKRGGGAVCIKCPSCWSVFSNTIEDFEPCPIKPKKHKITEIKPTTSKITTNSAEDLIRKLVQLVNY